MRGLVTTNATGIPYPKVCQMSVDAPVTVGDVRPMQMEMGYHGAANKDAPNIGERYQGTTEAPIASRCKVETTLMGLSAE